MALLERRAAEEGTTVTELVESALRAFLLPAAPALQPASAERTLPPLSTFDGGRQLVELDRRAARLDPLDGDDGG